MIEQDKIIKEAIESENNGIVFLDRVVVSAGTDRAGGDVSEGVQRDLLPLMKEQLSTQSTETNKTDLCFIYCFRGTFKSLQNLQIFYQSYKVVFQ